MGEPQNLATLSEEAQQNQAEAGRVFYLRGTESLKGAGILSAPGWEWKQDSAGWSRGRQRREGPDKRGGGAQGQEIAKVS